MVLITLYVRPLEHTLLFFSFVKFRNARHLMFSYEDVRIHCMRVGCCQAT